MRIQRKYCLTSLPPPSTPSASMKIFTEFTEVSNDKGAVMITHRIFNLIDMHRILVLSGGRIAEDGSHERAHE